MVLYLKDSRQKFKLLGQARLFASTFAVEKAGHENMYLVPFPLIALYLLAFFKTKIVYPVYVISLLPLLIFAHSGGEMFTRYLFAGVVTIFHNKHRTVHAVTT